MTLMRRGAAIAAVALLLPAELTAQQVTLPGILKPRPGRPAPLPPQPEPIARNLAYKRMRLAVESYPLISYVRAPGFGAARDGWTSFGSGTRAEYRLTPHVSATLDLTSSFAGGPMDVHTAELGTRLRPERTDRRLYPFFDVRGGYIISSGGYLDPITGDYGYPTSPNGSAFTYSHGFGGVAGVGMEYALTRRFSLTTAASVMRNLVTMKALTGSAPNERSYDMTLFRYTVGLRYNPGRWVRVPGSDMY